MVSAACTAAAMAIVLVACSESTPGRALPTGVSFGTTTTTTLQTTISRGNEALDRVDPCALLNPAEIGQFGADPGTRHGGQSDRACDWDVPNGGGFQIVLRNSQSVGELVIKGGRVADHNVGNRKGKIVRDNVVRKSCMVSFEMTTWSRVDVIASARDTEGACDYSTRVATLIEPRLPKGG
jgi:hypothetical protein